MHRHLWTGLLLMSVVTAFAGRANAGLRAPLAGEGDFEFVADMPVFDLAARRSRVDLSIRIDHPQLRFRPAYGNPFQAEVELRVKLAREGLVVVDTTQVYEFVATSAEEATDARRFELIEMPLMVGEGSWAVTLEMVDRQATREGLHRRVHSTASGVLWVPPAGQRATMSDPEFRLGPESLPNPERLFGVVQDTLVAYFEIRGGDPAVARSLQVEVRDPIYGGMDQQVLRFLPAGSVQARLYKLPLASFPEGNYVLSLSPSWIEGPPREYDFTVVWKMGRFAQRGGDLLLEAKLLLGDDELERFRKLAPGAQSALLSDFWERHDPTPGTSRNETRDLFRERVAYAWRFFGEALVPGPLTDRGQIFVKYGPPRSREVQVIPSNSDDLESAVTKIHDAYGIEFEGVIAREGVNDSDALGRRNAQERDQIATRDRRRLNSRIGSEGSFELWIYDMDGRPLFGDDGGWSENIGFRFLFVDRRGDGSYRLEATNLANRSRG